jgi:hypothetical protein
MKPYVMLRPLALAMLLMLSCEVNITSDHGSGSRKIPSLKSFTYQGRTYELFYNTQGDVDSVLVTDDELLTYSYRVWYNNGRIDSVNLVENGELISTHRDFQYDQNDRITGYTYCMRDAFGAGYFYRYSVEYDEQDEIQKTDNKTVYTCNTPGNLTETTRISTFDYSLNPLLLINNAFALFIEEPMLRPVLFNKHNAKTETLGNILVEYEHEYDEQERLVRKIGRSNGEVIAQFEFVYAP